jgi:hypothetical protein
MPAPVRQLGQRLLEREAEDCVLDPLHAGDVDRLAACVRARAAHGPPAPPECRSGDDSEPQRAPLLERDQRRPDRNPAGVVACAVDRVDDPAPLAGAARPELLAEDAVGGPRRGEARAQVPLDGAVGLGDGRQVGLRLDGEVVGAETRQRDRVGRVRELEREREVGIAGQSSCR